MTFREYLRNNTIIAFLYWLPVRLFLKIARFFPLQQKIVFNSFSGKGFCDDPKYIFLELAKRNLQIKYIWLVNNLDSEMPAQIKKVKHDSWQATYHYLTAKIWIDNAKSNPKPSKRKGQFYLQTWHGSFSNKMVEKDAENNLNSTYIKASQKDSSKIDLMYSNNDFRINCFKNSFWYKGPVIKSDSPQLSVLVNTPPRLKENICSQLGVNIHSKIVLYAPTFRNNQNLDVYKWNYRRILQALKIKFGYDFVFFLRLHPNIHDEITTSSEKDILDVTNYPDIDELIAISDVMITDFSGVAYDMAIVKKPVFMFAQDFNDYLQNDRQLYFPIEQLPFTIAKEEEVLCKNILSFNQHIYNDKVSDFMKKIGMEEHGNGAQNIADIVYKQIKK